MEVPSGLIAPEKLSPVSWPPSVLRLVRTVVVAERSPPYGGKAAPFVYQGQARYQSHHGGGPMSVVFLV